MANEDTFHLGIKALIRSKTGEILVLKGSEKRKASGKGHWDLPGGRIHKGENIESALKREVGEEIGLNEITVYELFDASMAKLRINFEHGLILFTFLCSIKDHSVVKLTDDEHTEFKWCSPKESAKLLSVKFSDQFVEKLAKL